MLKTGIDGLLNILRIVPLRELIFHFQYCNIHCLHVKKLPAAFLINLIWFKIKQIHQLAVMLKTKQKSSRIFSIPASLNEKQLRTLIDHLGAIRKQTGATIAYNPTHHVCFSVVTSRDWSFLAKITTLRKLSVS